MVYTSRYMRVKEKPLGLELEAEKQLIIRSNYNKVKRSL
jgi:hypothetical protein